MADTIIVRKAWVYMDSWIVIIRLSFCFLIFSILGTIVAFLEMAIKIGTPHENTNILLSPLSFMFALTFFIALFILIFRAVLSNVHGVKAGDRVGLVFGLTLAVAILQAMTVLGIATLFLSLR